MELYFGRPIVWSHNGEVPEYLTSHGRTSGELTRYFREKLIKNLRGVRAPPRPTSGRDALFNTGIHFPAITLL